MLRPLAESARVSNLPTVWTNVLVGFAVVGVAAEASDISVPLQTLALSLVSVSLLYIGGMLLNDAADADWDAEHGKDRPIPTGRLTRRTAFVASAVLLATGAVLPIVLSGFDATVSVAALSLLAAIVLYDLLHKRSAWTVLLMAACRGLVYFLAAAVSFAGIDDVHGRAGTSAVLGSVAAPALAVFAYTVLLTLAARREDREGVTVSRVLAGFVPLPFLIAASAYQPERLLWTIFAAVAFFAWCAMAARDAVRGRVREGVLAWLAGFCLADAFLLMLLNRLELAAVAVVCWFVTVIAHRGISGT